MEDDTAAPESLLPSEEWTEEALRSVMARALNFAGANGLPGEHHFYITFRTDYPGVSIPPRLLAQYPQEMTIVLQHQFWDLRVDEAERIIRVGLSFGGIPSSLVIPMDAVLQFADPHARLGLRFRAVEPPEVTSSGPVAVLPERENTPATPGTANESNAANAEEAADSDPEKPAETPQVVSLDAFRRRPPPKT
jgi:hypothetical protein